MIRDITIGQYYPVASPLHRLDPRVKIIATLVYIVSLFLVQSFVGYGFIFAALVTAIVVSRVPVKFMLRGLKSIVLIIIFTAVLNLVAQKGGQPLVTIWRFTITTQGVLMAVKMCFRLIMLIVGSSLLTLTTTPIRLTDGLEVLLSPFRRIGVPSHEIAMMMTIALRFIPTLLDETDKIMKAQQARGADFTTGSLVQRGRALVPILVPLFISAFRRADELAMAMESRCYRGGEGRTRMNQIHYERRDVMGFVVMVVYLGIVITIRMLVG